MNVLQKRLNLIVVLLSVVFGCNTKEGARHLSFSELSPQEKRIVIHQVLQGQKADTESYCQDDSTDNGIALVCHFANYLHTKNHDRWLRSIKKEKLISRLWQINRLYHLELGQVFAAKQIPNSDFALTWIEHLSQLALHGNVKALKTLMHLNRQADGYLAEEIDEKILQLFLQNPAIVINHWDLLAADLRRDQFATTAFDAEKKARLLKNMNRLCGNESKSTCQEIVAWINQQ